MATHTVGSGDCIKPFRKNRIRAFPEGASQTFNYGDLLVGDASTDENRVVVGAADPTAGTIVGFAAEDASGTTGNLVSVFLADDDAEFVGRVQDTGTLANSNLGTEYDIVVDTTNAIFRIDLADTTNAYFHVLQLFDPVGDVNGRVVFKVVSAGRKYHTA